MLSLIQAAGWPIGFLILASVAALALIVERFLSLRRSRILPEGLLEDVLMLYRNRQVGPDMLQRLESSSPLGGILAAGLRHDLAPRDVMQESMEQAGRVVAHRLEKYLPALGTLASAAPLLGLFGTVIGMIEIFGAQAPGGSDPQQLAHGISVALYNTAFGLIIAVPSLILHRHFRTRVEGYLVEMEQQAQRLIDAIRAPAGPRLSSIVAPPAPTGPAPDASSTGSAA